VEAQFEQYWCENSDYNFKDPANLLLALLKEFLTPHNQTGWYTFSRLSTEHIPPYMYLLCVRCGLSVEYHCHLRFLYTLFYLWTLTWHITI